MISSSMARDALERLGVADVDGELSLATLLGILLALTEIAIKEDHGHEAIPEIHTGYISTLLTMSGGDTQTAVSHWIVQVDNRLIRSGIELHEVIDGDGSAITNIAVPAIMGARNALAMLGSSKLDRDSARALFDAAEQNLKTAQTNLEKARRTFRRDLGIV